MTENTWQSRASDADREHVAQVLSTAFVEGRLTKDEYEARLDQALHAVTMDQLSILTQDLLPVVQSIHAAETSGLPQIVKKPKRSQFLVAVFSETNRVGHWEAAATLNPVVVFGETKIDLRHATFTSDQQVINVTVIFGELEVRVPEGVGVVLHVVPILGSAKTETLVATKPGFPTVTLRGLVLFGEVTVTH